MNRPINKSFKIIFLGFIMGVSKEKIKEIIFTCMSGYPEFEGDDISV